MLMPSFSIIAVAVTAMAILAVADWYVWGASYSSDLRLPRRLRPFSATEFADRALGRLIEVNQAVLPEAALHSTHAHTATAADEHEGGFKKVA